MRAITTAAGCVLMVCSVSASAQAYRCQTAAGTVYQQQPCESKAGRQIAPAPGPADPGEARSRASSEIAAADRSTRTRSAIASRRVFVGMSSDDALQAWGNPLTVNRTITAGRASEQWVYRSADGAQYVYVEGGVVTAVQTQPSIGYLPAPCLSEDQYRNAQVMSNAEKTPEKMRKLADARCSR